MGIPLREYTLAQVEEFEDRLHETDWELGLGAVLPSLPKDLQAYITNELLLCPVDFRYWAERYCKVVDPSGNLVNLHLRQSQEKMFKSVQAQEENAGPLPRGKVGAIIVKARRIGATVLWQSMLAHGYLLRPDAKALTGSDTPDNTHELDYIQSRIYDKLPAWMRPRRTVKTKIGHNYFPALDSELKFTFGDAKNPVQGMRQDFVHLTEVSSWLAIKMVKADMYPCFLGSQVPTSFFAMESTADSKIGSGREFEKMYKAAQAGTEEFVPLFVSWQDCPEMWTADPAGVEFNETTKAVAERIKRETGYECRADQLAWYQQKRRSYEATGDLQTFFQEFPTSVEDCWQYGFNSAITLETRDRIKQAAKKPEIVLRWRYETKGFADATATWKAGDSPINHAFIFEPPQKGAIYVVGVDGAHGDHEFDELLRLNKEWQKGEKDPSAVEVLRVETPTSRPEQVASWVGYVRPDDLALIAEKFGKMYCDETNDNYPAMMACEVNPGSPSAYTQDILQKRGYPHFYVWPKKAKIGGGYTNALGWSTTPGTRGWITGGIVEALEFDRIIVNSPVTIEQMKTFVRTQTPSGLVRLDHDVGYHDDSLFALGIALFCSQEPAATEMAKAAHRASLKGPDAPNVINAQAVGAQWVPGEGWVAVVVRPGDDTDSFSYPVADYH